MTNFIKSSTNPDNYYEHKNKEICFIGRSNVGKSSLINKITNSKIARTSKTPGRTRLINFFSYNDQIMVDLPGYGFSRVDKKTQVQMDSFVKQYFLNRKNLSQTFLLIDSKVGPTQLDLMMIDFLKFYNINFYIFCTKADKLNQKLKQKTINKMRILEADYLFVSSLKKTNIEQAKKIILEAYN